MLPCVHAILVRNKTNFSTAKLLRKLGLGGVPLCQRTLRGFRRPARRGTAVRAACSRWLHRCCGRLRPYCTPSWRHSRVQQRLGRTAPRYYIIRGPGKVHGGAGGGGSGGRNEGAPVGDSPPFARLSKLVAPSMRTSRRSWTRETSPPLSPRGTVHAGRPRTLPSTLAFISPTAGRECSRHQ